VTTNYCDVTSSYVLPRWLLQLDPVNGTDPRFTSLLRRIATD